MSDKPVKIGILTHDTGDYDAYVAFFDDPERLEAAVKILNAERRDLDAGDFATAEVQRATLHRVPDVIDDAFLDILAGHLSEAGVEIERTHERNERLREEAEEAEADRQDEEERRKLPIEPAPGQERMDL